MGITDVREAIAWQADHADKADAPITARVVRAELAILDTPTELARRMSDWPGLSLEDAMPLRVAGGLHWLHLSGAEPAAGAGLCGRGDRPGGDRRDRRGGRGRVGREARAVARPPAADQRGGALGELHGRAAVAVGSGSARGSS